MNTDDVQIEAEDPEAEEQVAGKVKKLRDEIETLRKEKQEYLDGWQRAKADYVNALKRFDEDTKKASELGILKAVEAFLPAFDALERAKEHGELPPGFEGIVKQLESSMKSLKVETVGEVGEKFNANIHEAMGQEKVADKEQDDTVLHVFEKGYQIGEKVIRPAKVKVAQH